MKKISASFLAVAVASVGLIGVGSSANAAPNVEVVTSDGICIPTEAIAEALQTQYRYTVETPGSPAVEEQSHHEYRFGRTVVVKDAVPAKDAVTETREKWSISTFIDGWTKTDKTRDKIITEGVDEKTHQEFKFTRTVIDQPFVPEIPAVAEVTEQRLVSPATPAVYETVVITPAVPAQEAVYATEYQYQKQTKTTVQHGKKGDVTLVSDWSWWESPSTQWSTSNKEVLESGVHAKWDEFHWGTVHTDYFVRDYRYVKNGVTKQGALIKPAVPAKPAVTEERLVKAAQPAKYETVVIVQAVPAVPAIPEKSHTEESGWVTEIPAGSGWTKVDEKTVTDVEAVAEVKKTEYLHTKTVVITPAVPAEDEVTEDEETDWLVEIPIGNGWETIEQKKIVTVEAVDAVEPTSFTSEWTTESAPVGANPEKTETRTVTLVSGVPAVECPAVAIPPATVVDEPVTVVEASDTGLAATGLDASQYILIALGLGVGGTALVGINRRKKTN